MNFLYNNASQPSVECGYNHFISISHEKSFAVPIMLIFWSRITSKYSNAFLPNFNYLHWQLWDITIHGTACTWHDLNLAACSSRKLPALIMARVMLYTHQLLVVGTMRTQVACIHGLFMDFDSFSAYGPIGVLSAISMLTFGLGCGLCQVVCSTVDLCRFCVFSLHREVHSTTVALLLLNRRFW